MIRIVGIDSPEVRLEEGNGHLTAEKLGILRAMRVAVALAAPGDLILQNDMELIEDHEGTIETIPGRITILDEPTSAWSHVCPRAFIIPDEATRQLLLDLWADETRRACHGWDAIPKLQGPVLYHHERRSP